MDQDTGRLPYGPEGKGGRERGMERETRITTVYISLFYLTKTKSTFSVFLPLVKQVIKN